MPICWELHVIQRERLLEFLGASAVGQVVVNRNALQVIKVPANVPKALEFMAKVRAKLQVPQIRKLRQRIEIAFEGISGDWELGELSRIKIFQYFQGRQIGAGEIQSLKLHEAWKELRAVVDWIASQIELDEINKWLHGPQIRDLIIGDAQRFYRFGEPDGSLLLFRDELRTDVEIQNSFGVVR